jgi:two-component system NtrC family response regulator
MSKALILIVEDDPTQRRFVQGSLESEDYSVLAAGSLKEAVAAVERHPVDVALVDYKLAGETGIDVIRAVLERNPLVTPIMITAYGQVEIAVEAIKAGAYDFIVKPVDFKKLMLVIDRALERHKLRQEIQVLRNSIDEKFRFENLVVVSPKMEGVARLAGKAAKSDVAVLVSGETGTGKDLIAKTIHYASRRRNGPFLAANLPSLPETLLESELFGAEKGAYTGAVDRKIGLFETASGGTLYLDEIGDLSLHLQVKLLRFLQEKEFTRLGSSKPLKSDVRIIAATNKDPERLVAQEKFRPDLYYRLNVIRIVVPPLRERREDIPALVDHFLRTISRRENRTIRGLTAEAMAALMRNSFPGNIRELENIIERAVVFSEGDTIRLADLPAFIDERENDAVFEPPGSLEEKVKRLEIREIEKALAEAGGIKSRAARALGITKRILGYKAKKYNLSGDEKTND